MKNLIVGDMMSPPCGDVGSAGFGEMPSPGFIGETPIGGGFCGDMGSPGFGDMHTGGVAGHILIGG